MGLYFFTGFAQHLRTAGCDLSDLSHPSDICDIFDLFDLSDLADLADLAGMSDLSDLSDISDMSDLLDMYVRSARRVKQYHDLLMTKHIPAIKHALGLQCHIGQFLSSGASSVPVTVYTKYRYPLLQPLSKHASTIAIEN